MNSPEYFMGRSINKVCQTFKAMIWCGSLITWTRYLAASPSPRSSLKPTQALDGLGPSSAAFRKCLRELRSICGATGMLPTSYALPPHLLDVGPTPFASGGYGDVYKGTFDGRKVCIKRLRVYLKDGPQKAAKVRYRRRRLPVHHL